MDTTQDRHLDRVDRHPSAVSRGRRRALAEALLAVLVLTACGYVAYEAVDGWAPLVVLGGTVLAAAGVTIAFEPLRRP